MNYVEGVLKKDQEEIEIMSIVARLDGNMRAASFFDAVVNDINRIRVVVRGAL